MQEENQKAAKEFTFSGQREHEEVAEVIRRHPYTIYRPGFWTVLAMVLALSVFLFFPKFYYLAVILIGFVGVYFWSAFYGYLQSVLIITSERVFSIDQKGFFRRKISETSLDVIIDVSSEMKGFFKTVLCNGDLIIRSSGAREEGDFVVEDIPDPYYAQQKIAKMRAKPTD